MIDTIRLSGNYFEQSKCNTRSFRITAELEITIKAEKYTPKINNEIGAGHGFGEYCHGYFTFVDVWG